MASYLLKKEDKNNEIKDVIKTSGYTFKPNNKNKNHLEVNSLTIIKPTMIDAILTTKFNINYRKLVMIVFNILQTSDEETSEGDIMIALDEIAKSRQIILNKYQKFLKKEKEEKFIKQLRLLENELRAKQINMRMNLFNQMYIYDDEKSRGGR